MCVRCEVSQTHVKDTRQTEDGFVRRLRQCDMCEFRFATVEYPISAPRNKTDFETFKLMKRDIIPKLIALADSIDLLNAEHD